MAVKPATEDWLSALDREREPCLSDIYAGRRELRELTADTIAALRAANSPPHLFVRAAKVVRLDRDEDQRPVIISAAADHIISEMARAANYCVVTRRKDKDSNETLRRSAVHPPPGAARDLLSGPVPELGFPPLVAVAEAPFFRPDGSLCLDPGYDPATRTYLAPRGDLNVTVPDDPMSEVAEARDLILELLQDFRL
jgi:putative DNA primase/helicase